MWIPTFFYELMPIVYIMAGVFSIRNLESDLGQGSGWLLLAAALTIIKLRLEYRRPE